MQKYYEERIRNHNLVKMSILQFLSFLQLRPTETWITAANISRHLGMGKREHASLLVLLGRWCEWRLITRRHHRSTGDIIHNRIGSGVFEYKITARGQSWLRFIPKTELKCGLPPLAIREMVSGMMEVTVWFGTRKHAYQEKLPYDKIHFIEAPFISDLSYSWENNDRGLRPGDAFQMRGTLVLLPATDGADALRIAEKITGKYPGQGFIDVLTKANAGIVRV